MVDSLFLDCYRPFSSLQFVFAIGISQKGKLLKKKEYITRPRVYHMEDESLKEREDYCKL